MSAAVIVVGLLAVAAGVAYLFKKQEVAAAKADIQYAHDKLAQLEAGVKSDTHKADATAKAYVTGVIARVRSVLIKHLPEKK